MEMNEELSTTIVYHADSPNVAASRTAAGIRRRLAAQKASSSSASNRPATQPGSMMRIYMDDSPGVKVYGVQHVSFMAS
ncbi:hypothetical protein BATDEDRAFT_86379 [Batrachochytrium dendrobatidis JAM81]|uniref:Uncharacterized protein n=1 Tax=Batrachochytrium dendrobatidis (strain JAM81 / FGSC 10211) TaxID=684364 RepID=F4NWW4_BATDJ|nr:uncharacterized protein BATDEDRAFT_86379 [Batrachochytrium dendrobatidis JAM81]EGF82891.1 hypothetical protein BATDEDRAFT_86379 [Batrachochytrium dendrobatidis JAM81]|eukprot:XP_006677088.1 hypothetical protein BATDEDRAFT_86379 [Batrachochytrium dendrobatidis JAM81]